MCLATHISIGANLPTEGCEVHDLHLDVVSLFDLTVSFRYSCKTGVHYIQNAMRYPHVSSLTSQHQPSRSIGTGAQDVALED